MSDDSAGAKCRRRFRVWGLIGVVRTVSQYPVTAQGVPAFEQRSAGAQWILQTQQGAVMEVTFDLVKDPDSESGYL